MTLWVIPFLGDLSTRPSRARHAFQAALLDMEGSTVDNERVSEGTEWRRS